MYSAIPPSSKMVQLTFSLISQQKKLDFSGAFAAQAYENQHRVIAVFVDAQVGPATFSDQPGDNSLAMKLYNHIWSDCRRPGKLANLLDTNKPTDLEIAYIQKSDSRYRLQAVLNPKNSLSEVDKQPSCYRKPNNYFQLVAAAPLCFSAYTPVTRNLFILGILRQTKSLPKGQTPLIYLLYLCSKSHFLISLICTSSIACLAFNK